MRLFISFKIPRQIKAQIFSIQNDLKTHNLPIRYDGEEKLHLTLVFLGDVKESHLTGLEELTFGISQRYEPLNLNLIKFGYFWKRYGNIPFWVGPGRDLERLFLIQRELHVRAAEITKTHGREDFVPHIRIGKWQNKISAKGGSASGGKKQKVDIKNLERLWKAEYEKPIARFDTLELIHSIPRGRFHQHKTLKTFRLGN